MPDWARTIARRVLYEAADELRLEALKTDPDPEVAGLAAKIDREEVYHRMHAEMWLERLRDEPRFREAMDELWPYALALLPESERPRLAERFGRDVGEGMERGPHSDALGELWDEMTSVRRSAPAGAAW